MKKKLIWGGIILLFFSVAAVRFYNHGKANSAVNQRAARVSTVPVEADIVGFGPVEAVINVTGSIQGVQEANISAKATGRIEQMLVTDGDFVEQGQLLALIDARELAAQYMQAQANATSAQANMTNAERNYERMRSLAQQGAVAQRELDSAQTQHEMATAQISQNAGNIQLLEAQLGNTRITAPFSGYIARRTLSQGEMVSSGAVLLAVVDLRQVKIEVFVSEQDIGRVKPGQNAVFTVDAYPGRTFTGTVTEISPAADPRNRAFKVKILADNTEKLLKSGMFARVRIIHDQKKAAVTVAKAAIVDKEGRPVVFVINNDIAEQREVTVGMGNEQSVEILQGLQTGETIATFGHDVLKNGDRVSVVRKGGQ